MVFMVDSSDPDHFHLAKELLDELLAENELQVCMIMHNYKL